MCVARVAPCWAFDEPALLSSLCLMLLRSLALSMCDETQEDNGDGFGTKIWSHDLPWLQNTNFCASTLVCPASFMRLKGNLRFTMAFC